MTRWQRRIERAGELARECPASAELMYFYCDIARFQSTVTQPAPEDVAPLLDLIRRTSPDPRAALHAALPLPAFLARVVLQPATEHQAAAKPGVDATCPACGEKPVALILRPHGACSLLCSLCFTEWGFPSTLCPACGEGNPSRRTVCTSDEFAHVSIHACETCRAYIKTIDLTQDGESVPEVDELASIALDLVAVQRGYHKLQVNLFGV
jgi:formate dehydrogenase accessory protein FdhE